MDDGDRRTCSTTKLSDHPQNTCTENPECIQTVARLLLQAEWFFEANNSDAKFDCMSSPQSDEANEH